MIKMNNNEKKTIIELICKEQTEMIVEDHLQYDSDRYRLLEELKVKIKDM